MTTDQMTQDERDVAAARESSNKSDLDQMAAATMRMGVTGGVPSGVLRVIEHYLQELDQDAALNVVQDLLSGRNDRWKAEAYALDAIRNGRSSGRGFCHANRPNRTTRCTRSRAGSSRHRRRASTAKATRCGSRTCGWTTRRWRPRDRTMRLTVCGAAGFRSV